MFIALQPLAQVMQIEEGNNFCAASQVFSPSTIKIVFFLSSKTLLRLNIGLGAGGALYSHFEPL